MKKKAQGLPLNVIIIAAIVLIVLVVLWAIFTGRMGVFSKGVSDITKGTTCIEAGGVVKTQVEGCKSVCTAVYGQFSDVKTDEVCCKPAKKEACTGTYTDATGGAPKECGVFDKEESCPTDKGCSWNEITKDDC